MNNIATLSIRIFITGIILVLSNMTAFKVCAILGVSPTWQVVTLPVTFILWRLLFRLSMKGGEAITNGIAGQLSKSLSSVSEQDAATAHNEILRFRQTCQKEKTAIQVRCENEYKQLVAQAIQYTRITFLRLGFTEDEVLKVCSCVEYFVSNQEVLRTKDLSIPRRTSVTQIALQNFSWNVAYPFHISGTQTADFVKHTFASWFPQTEVGTIRKNLRTTRGHHLVLIDEHAVVKQPLQ